MKTFIASIMALLVLVSCSTKIDFEQTCLTCIQSQRLSCKDYECPVTAMVDTNCIVVMSETGEKINMNEILKQEKLSIRAGINVTVAKIRGRYFITGEGFRNLWMLKPIANQAKIYDFALPAANLKMPPVFEINNKNLLMRGAEHEYTYIFDIDKEKWQINNNYPKAGN